MQTARRICAAAIAFAAVGATAAAEIRPLVGTYSRLKAKRGDTIPRIARREDVNRDLLAALNHVRGSRVRPGRSLTLPKLHILPRQPKEGIVLNIPERNVYLFRRGQIKAVFPVALGSASWPTPTGVYKIASKEINPKWKPTQEMVDREEIKDEPVPPGKDNPVGDRWMGWTKKGYGFHSTKAPDSIGRAVSHGCVRLYPEAAHKMFGLVRIGEPIFVEYEPITAGRREGRYYLSVFPDIYHRNLVSLSRAKAILKKDGLLSRANMGEVAQIVRRRMGYPQLLNLRPQVGAKRGKIHKPPGSKRAALPNRSDSPAITTCGDENLTQSRRSVEKLQPAKPGLKPGPGKPGVKAKPGDVRAPVPPVMTPEQIATARGQWSLLLSRFRSGQVKLVNQHRDLVQLEQLSSQGYLLTSDNRSLTMDLRLGQALARLANRTSLPKPLVLLSVYRMYSATRPREPHANGLAADISAFAGHDICNLRPSEAVDGVIQVVQTLPPGRYRLGLPKPPKSDPVALLPPPERVRHWPFFPAPVPGVGQIGALTLVLPRMAGARPDVDESGRFRPEITRWANERSAPRSDLGDGRLRRALTLAARHGIIIVLAFPDAADHLHLDVVPEKAEQPKRI